MTGEIFHDVPPRLEFAGKVTRGRGGRVYGAQYQSKVTGVAEIVGLTPKAVG